MSLAPSLLSASIFRQMRMVSATTDSARRFKLSRRSSKSNDILRPSLSLQSSGRKMRQIEPG